jgi:hypothetical protein
LLGVGWLLLLTCGLYHRALGLWWMYDDFFHLRFIASFSPLAYFFDAEVWQQGPQAVFTPAFMLSLDTDLALFGLRPPAFLAHQLLALAALAWALVSVLCLWLPRGFALAAGTLFLVGPLVASIAPVLMVRHYLEALVLVALALRLAARSLRLQSWSWAAGSALLYLLACLCKEIAVPLLACFPILLAAAAESRWRQLRFLLPHAIALATYLMLRARMLDGWLSGYGWALPSTEMPSFVASLAPRVGSEIATGQAVGALMLAVMIGVSLVLVRSPRTALLAVGLAAVALLPIVPVAVEMQPRFALVSWLLLVGAFASGCARLAGWSAGGSRVAWLCMSCTIMVAAVANRTQWNRELPDLLRRSIENRAYVGLDAGEYLRLPREAAAALGELDRLKQERLGGAAGAGWFRDDLFLCVQGSEIERLWEFQPQPGRLEEITARLPVLRREACANLQRKADLGARFAWRGNVLSWKLRGPPGEFSFVFAEGRERIAVPARGGYRMVIDEVVLRVRHQGVDGAVAYSPPLALSAQRGEFEWQ